MTTLYLASGSPRRQELLTQLGFSFEQVVPGIEEQRRAQESAQQYVVRLARERRRLAWRWFPVICRCWARIR
ncbi:Septum formation protein Maf [Salmonella enterica subsp. enterica]|uniref:Septum formation protein Maf n=1 Tax=Salmonella enterica I TaxID=59201 RepID=A0A447N360_SALET|nr:Septum formation protein Maf [Salmonella enterica subsp. enterica]